MSGSDADDDPTRIVLLRHGQVMLWMACKSGVKHKVRRSENLVAFRAKHCTPF